MKEITVNHILHQIGLVNHNERETTMPKGNNQTIAQHTVPRVYLRGFSDDNERIRYYDFRTQTYSNGRIKIEDLCVNKNMYEFYDDDGNIDSTNIIENQLGKYEIKYNHYCRKFNAMMNSQNLSYFVPVISDEDVAYWTVYSVIQLLRSKHTITSLQKLLSEKYPDNSQNQIKNTVLYNCLPIFINPEDGKTFAFYRILDWFLEMNFSVVLSPHFEFITSDNPVCGIADNNYGVCRFVFPLTKNIVIQFIDKIDDGYNGRTIASPTQKYVDSINYIIGVKAEKQIYFERLDQDLLNQIINTRTLNANSNIGYDNNTNSNTNTIDGEPH